MNNKKINKIQACKYEYTFKAQLGEYGTSMSATYRTNDFQAIEINAKKWYAMQKALVETQSGMYKGLELGKLVITITTI